jgi:SAM-dependent methyltransferase
MIHNHESYATVLEKLNNGARLLDVGCCFGQDLRKLAGDGVPADNLYAVEIMQGFLDASFDFFGDRANPPAHFITADLLDESNTEVNDLLGTVDVVHISMVLHIWDWATQIRACERLVALLRPVPGALVLGRLIGRLEACNWRGPEGRAMYKHDLQSFARLWEEVGQRTETKWAVRAEFAGKIGVRVGTVDHWDDPPSRRVMFEVERLE